MHQQQELSLFFLSFLGLILRRWVCAVRYRSFSTARSRRPTTRNTYRTFRFSFAEHSTKRHWGRRARERRISSDRTPCPDSRRSTLLATSTTAAWVGRYREETRSAGRSAAPNSPPLPDSPLASRRTLSPPRRCSCSTVSAMIGTSTAPLYPRCPFAMATHDHRQGRTSGNRRREYWKS